MCLESCYLLIMACSQRKRLDPGWLPAIDRYDGGNYRVLRKARKEGYWPENLDVLILSAKYGLVGALAPIHYYEQRMTPERARELKPEVTEALKACIQQERYREVYVDLGRDYLPAVEGLEELFKDSSLTYAEGRIGERLAQLRCWLVTKCGQPLAQHLVSGSSR